MEIKRLNNGAVSWPQNGASEAASQKPTPTPEASLESIPAGALDGVRAQFQRADLSTPKFESILRQSIDALLDSAAASGQSIPSGVRQKVSDYLASDPLFASRVRVFWEKNLK